MTSLVSDGLSEDLKEVIEHELGGRLDAVSLLPSGMHGRTFRVKSGAEHWVVRLNVRRRTILAQERAGLAGMRVPRITCCSSELDEEGRYTWVIEEFVEGEEFFPDRFGRNEAKAISVDLGHQLRLIHSVELGGYGVICEEGLRGRHDTRESWLSRQEENIEPATEHGRLGDRALATIGEAFAAMRAWPREDARLIHGDFADDNLLVSGLRLAAAVDWECAEAGDPARDVAYWHLWHGDEEYLEVLLGAYEPDDASGFRERVMVHRVVLAVWFIEFYTMRNDQAGIAYCREVLGEDNC